MNLFSHPPDSALAHYETNLPQHWGRRLNGWTTEAPPVPEPPGRPRHSLTEWCWCCREIFLRPSRDIVLLKDRLDSIEYFCKPATIEITQHLKSNLSKLRNMTVSGTRTFGHCPSLGAQFTWHTGSIQCAECKIGLSQVTLRRIMTLTIMWWLE